MNPKKPYQRRLPTVLPPVQPLAQPPVQPPTPRVAPELESLPPEADLLPAVAPPVPPPLPPPTFEEPDQPADEPEPEPAGPRDRRATIALVALAWLVGGGVLAYTLVDGLRDDPAEPGAGGSAAPPRALARAESYVDTQVLPAGDLVVRQWIRAREPLTALGLELPDVTGAEDLSADQVEVVAGGVVAAGPGRVTAAGATFTFEESTSVQVTYRLEGAVQVSDSAAGRALAVVTTLDTAYAPRVERETRVVHGPEVLSLACSRQPDGSPEPCGRGRGDDQWQVDLRGDRVGDRVQAQLNLG
jgi:hypothetical protein